MSTLKDSMKQYCHILYSGTETYWEGELDGHFVCYKLQQSNPPNPIKNILVNIPWLHPYNPYPLPMSEAFHMNRLIWEFCKDDVEKVKVLGTLIDTKNVATLPLAIREDSNLLRDFCTFLFNHPEINWKES
jgi:hypothetical protein